MFSGWISCNGLEALKALVEMSGVIIKEMSLEVEVAEEVLDWLDSRWGSEYVWGLEPMKEGENVK